MSCKVTEKSALKKKMCNVTMFANWFKWKCILITCYNKIWHMRLLKKSMIFRWSCVVILLLLVVTMGIVAERCDCCVGCSTRRYGMINVWFYFAKSDDDALIREVDIRVYTANESFFLLTWILWILNEWTMILLYLSIRPSWIWTNVYSVFKMYEIKINMAD